MYDFLQIQEQEKNKDEFISKYTGRFYYVCAYAEGSRNGSRNLKPTQVYLDKEDMEAVFQVPRINSVTKVNKNGSISKGKISFMGKGYCKNNALMFFGSKEECLEYYTGKIQERLKNLMIDNVPDSKTTVEDSLLGSNRGIYLKSDLLKLEGKLFYSVGFMDERLKHKTPKVVYVDKEKSFIELEDEEYLYLNTFIKEDYNELTTGKLELFNFEENEAMHLSLFEKYEEAASFYNSEIKKWIENLPDYIRKEKNYNPYNYGKYLFNKNII